MAQMIPENPPGSGSTEGEKRLFRILAKLPDDCIVYFEPALRHRRRPDFVVILPEVGVLVIEVKDWYLASVAGASHKTVTLRKGETTACHPVEQARGYVIGLRDECRRHPRAGMLMAKDGAYAGRYAFPFCNIGVLSNINRSQIEREAPDLLRIFPPDTCVTRDELAEWGSLDASALMVRLRSYFAPWWSFSKLSPEQVDILRSVVHPEIVIRSSETELAVLDMRQERNAALIRDDDGHHIVYGVAGSGKTVILIARAKLLAADPNRRVLLLCYNRLLAEYLAGAMAGWRNVEVMTFHRWGVRNGVAFSDDEETEDYGERLLPVMQNGARDRGKFDALLIDESQDWPCSWFRCALQAVKDPKMSEVLIVGDGSQSLYKRRGFTWKEAGVSAQGRTYNKRFDLDRNYRNTAEILRAARPFSSTVLDGDVVLAPPISPDTAIRSGPEPELVRLDDAASECHYAATLIEQWLRGGIQLRGRRVRVAPRDIAVLYPRERPNASVATLQERLGNFTRAVLLTGKRKNGALRDDAVRILSIHGSRGLQFKIVVLLWANLLPSGFAASSEAIDRGLLYVAMTRSEDMLVILHSGSSPYVDELYRVLDAAPAVP